MKAGAVAFIDQYFKQRTGTPVKNRTSLIIAQEPHFALCFTRQLTDPTTNRRTGAIKRQIPKMTKDCTLYENLTQRGRNLCCHYKNLTKIQFNTSIS